MDFITPIIILISLLGIPIGFFLRKVTGNEVDFGVRNLRVFQDIIFIILTSLMLTILLSPYIFIITILYICGIVFLVRKYLLRQILYFCLLITFIIISSIDINLLSIISSMTLLYGFSTGSLLAYLNDIDN